MVVTRSREKPFLGSAKNRGRIIQQLSAWGSTTSMTYNDLLTFWTLHALLESSQCKLMLTLAPSMKSQKGF